MWKIQHLQHSNLTKTKMVMCINAQGAIYAEMYKTIWTSEKEKLGSDMWRNTGDVFMLPSRTQWLKWEKPLKHTHT